ncbi:MAG: hypothetical protein IJ831_05340 [Spirochaetales bacterium]|nr:hypothetical protein [Spirochaetales bacterium]
MMRKLALTSLLTLMAIAVVFAADPTNKVSDAANLKLNASIEKGQGVTIPEGVTLVGNLAIQYRYGDEETPWEYVSTENLEITDLGERAGRVQLRCLYYGNEPESYSCIVSFASDGWARTMEDGKEPTDADKLAIIFEDAESTSSKKFEVDIKNSGFTLNVPVSAPINGDVVATINASWADAPDLPAGEYTADIIAAVTTP